MVSENESTVSHSAHLASLTDTFIQHWEGTPGIAGVPVHLWILVDNRVRGSSAFVWEPENPLTSHSQSPGDGLSLDWRSNLAPLCCGWTPGPTRLKQMQMIWSGLSHQGCILGMIQECKLLISVPIIFYTHPWCPYGACGFRFPGPSWFQTFFRTCSISSIESLKVSWAQIPRELIFSWEIRSK